MIQDLIHKKQSLIEELLLLNNSMRDLKSIPDLYRVKLSRKMQIEAELTSIKLRLRELHRTQDLIKQGDIAITNVSTSEPIALLLRVYQILQNKMYMLEPDERYFVNRLSEFLLKNTTTSIEHPIQNTDAMNLKYDGCFEMGKNR